MGKERCPTCGQVGLTPIPGGLNEYDPRGKLLPSHEAPNGRQCLETTTAEDAKRFHKEWKISGVPADHSLWPVLSELKTARRRKP